MVEVGLGRTAVRNANGAAAAGKRGTQEASRLGQKAKSALNGNAPSFVPANGSAPNGGGHSTPSYRNAAAGLLASSPSGDSGDQVRSVSVPKS